MSLKERIAQFPIIRQLLVERELKRKQAEIDDNYVELLPKNIERLEVVLNRDVLLERMPKNAIVAELGVDNGDFTAKILAKSQPKKLHLIDAWQSRRYPEEKFLAVKKRFENQRESGQIEINRGYSTDVLSNVPDGYFDWVYLDTGHGFSLTVAELALILRASAKF